MFINLLFQVRQIPLSDLNITDLFSKGEEGQLSVSIRVLLVILDKMPHLEMLEYEWISSLHFHISVYTLRNLFS